MANTKTPADHKPPQGKPRTVTVHGVTLTIDPAIFDDLDMLEDLYAMQESADGDGAGAFRMIPFLRRLLGDDYARVKKALRDPDTGRIPMESVASFVAELMEKAAPNS